MTLKLPIHDDWWWFMLAPLASSTRPNEINDTKHACLKNRIVHNGTRTRSKSGFRLPAEDPIMEVCPRMFHCITVCRAYSLEVAAHLWDFSFCKSSVEISQRILIWAKDPFRINHQNGRTQCSALFFCLSGASFVANEGDWIPILYHIYFM